MGPLSDQATLEQIATTTGGRYYFMPAVDEFFEVRVAGVKQQIEVRFD